MSDLFLMNTADLRALPAEKRPKSLKMALASVLRLTTEKPSDMMAQIRQLTDADLAWYGKVFETELGWTW